MASEKSEMRTVRPRRLIGALLIVVRSGWGDDEVDDYRLVEVERLDLWAENRPMATSWCVAAASGAT
jgi:hypothetical protein